MIKLNNYYWNYFKPNIYESADGRSKHLIIATVMKFMEGFNYQKPNLKTCNLHRLCVKHDIDPCIRSVYSMCWIDRTALYTVGFIQGDVDNMVNNNTVF